MQKPNPTITYYNTNTDNFISSTQTVDFTSIQDDFLSYIPSDGYILDFGCGSGRDSKYFLQAGYRVEPIDGAEEICHIASQYIGIQVKQMLFLELNKEEEYDGIWACASILHLTYEELKEVLEKMERALKIQGIIYMSFKYGCDEGIRSGRFFTDMNEDKIKKLLDNYKNLKIVKQWITTDVRLGREDELWLNLMVSKVYPNQI